MRCFKYEHVNRNLNMGFDENHLTYDKTRVLVSDKSKLTEFKNLVDRYNKYEILRMCACTQVMDVFE